MRWANPPGRSCSLVRYSWMNKRIFYCHSLPHSLSYSLSHSLPDSHSPVSLPSQYLSEVLLLMVHNFRFSTYGSGWDAHRFLRHAVKHLRNLSVHTFKRDSVNIRLWVITISRALKVKRIMFWRNQLFDSGKRWNSMKSIVTSKKNSQSCLTSIRREWN